MRRQPFNFWHDAGQVMWKETVWLNGLRAAGAGVVWFVFAALTGYEGGNPLAILFMWPVAYATFLLPVGLIAGWLSGKIPLVGILALLMAVMVAVGDPLVFILSRLKPAWVPAEHPSVFKLHVIVFVTSPFSR